MSDKTILKARILVNIHDGNPVDSDMMDYIGELAREQNDESDNLVYLWNSLNEGLVLDD